MANVHTSNRSGFITRGGRSRRQTTWIGGQFLTNSVATGGTVLTATLNAAALALAPFTVVRTRGVIQITTDQVAANEWQAAAFGMLVANESAAAQGIASVPTPLTQSEDGLFFVYEAMLADFALATAVGIAKVSVERIIDSKAMRKIEVGDNIVSVWEVPAAGNGGTIVRQFIRMLAKLH